MEILQTVFQYFLEYNRYCNVLGIGVVIGLATLFSDHRSRINLRLMFVALAMQFAIAFLALKTSAGAYVLQAMADAVSYLYAYAETGVAFLFGKLADASDTPWGMIFAVKVLPLIVFFGAFMSLLLYCGVVQRIVGAIEYVVRPLLGTSGPETTCAIANSFLGQTEAPLLIRTYLARMTRSEMLVVMLSGMGTITSAILVVFVSMGVPAVSLLTASVMAIPATIMIAKILIPETEQHQHDYAGSQYDSKNSNVFDAIATGTSDGLYLALNVGAMLIAFIALMSMANGILSGICQTLNTWFSLGMPICTIDYLCSKLFYPFAVLLGFTGTEASSVAQLLGIKVGVNEFLAYCQLTSMNLSERTVAIVSFALCGFSNFSCIGIQVGGIGILAPEKRVMLTQLGIRAVLGAALANLMTAMIAGLFL